MQEVSDVKLDWMLNEIKEDGLSATESEVRQILAGDDHEDAALVDYVNALESECQAEGIL